MAHRAGGPDPDSHHVLPIDAGVGDRALGCGDDIGDHLLLALLDPRRRGETAPHVRIRVEEAGLLDLVEGETEVLPGVRVVPTPGHTAHHQSLLVETAAGPVFYAADLIPTSCHLPLPWIMSYDLDPLSTMESKRRLLERQREESWLLFFEHERGAPYGELEWVKTKKGERPVFKPLPLEGSGGA